MGHILTPVYATWMALVPIKASLCTMFLKLWSTCLITWSLSWYEWRRRYCTNPGLYLEPGNAQAAQCCHPSVLCVIIQLCLIMTQPIIIWYGLQHSNNKNKIYGLKTPWRHPQFTVKSEIWVVLGKSRSDICHCFAVYPEYLVDNEACYNGTLCTDVCLVPVPLPYSWHTQWIEWISL